MEHASDPVKRIAAIDEALAARYPETTALRFTSPWTLLVAAVLTH